jgi:ribose/xylose/arabinose/galactoside ABC-type transport system permease subunit
MIAKFMSNYGLALALLLEVVLFAILSPFFLTAENLLNVTLQISITAIIAAGMTFVILTGGIDLSVGSLVAVVGIVATIVLKIPDAFPLAIVAALAAGIAFGAFSGAIAGFFITRFRVTPFIVTLALMTIWRGAAFALTDGRPVWELPEGFSTLANGRVFGIPIPTLCTAAIFLLAHIALTRTVFGRYVLAVGGNAEAARLAGINTKRIFTSVYVLCGALAGVSGILLASRVNSGQPNAGMMYELDVIAAVVVGGTSLSGGRGSIVGTLLGSLLIGILRNGLNLQNVDSYVQQIVVGAVILLAVMLDQYKKK